MACVLLLSALFTTWQGSWILLLFVGLQADGRGLPPPPRPPKVLRMASVNPETACETIFIGAYFVEFFSSAWFDGIGAAVADVWVSAITLAITETKSSTTSLPVVCNTLSISRRALTSVPVGDVPNSGIDFQNASRSCPSLFKTRSAGNTQTNTL